MQYTLTFYVRQLQVVECSWKLPRGSTASSFVKHSHTHRVQMYSLTRTCEKEYRELTAIVRRSDKNDVSEVHVRAEFVERRHLQQLHEDSLQHLKHL